MDNAYLGIDCGSTSVKCIAIDACGNQLGIASNTYPTYSPRDGWMEQNPDGWIKPAFLAVRECVSRISAKYHVCGISFSGHMSSPVFLDADNRPVYRCMLVGDSRCEKQANFLIEHFAEEFKISTHNLPSACFVAPKILWFKENCPAEYERTASFVFAKDYVRYKMTGILNTDPTDAGNSLLFDFHSFTWNWSLIHRIGLKESIFRKVVPSSDYIGIVLPEVAEFCGLPKGTPVFCGAADMACSQLGTKCFHSDALSITLSTSGQVCMNIDNFNDVAFGKITYHQGARKDLHYGMGSVFSGGLALNWCYKLLFHRDCMEKADFDRMNALSEKAGMLSPGGSGMLFLPFLSGSGTPYFSPVDRGSFIGMTISTDPVQYFSAVMEGVSMHIRENVDVFHDMGCSIRRVYVGGGGTHMRAWMQTVANVLGESLEILQCLDASTLGAAIIALSGCNASADVVSMAESAVKICGVICPDEYYTSKYDQLYDIFRDYYKAMHNVQSKMNAWMGK